VNKIDLFQLITDIREVSELLNYSKSSLNIYVEIFFETGNIEKKIINIEV
jgi:hypothetical protein